MKWIFLLAIILSLSITSAFDLNVETVSEGNVVFREIKNPAVFDFQITNNGEGDFAQIYTLVDVAMTPIGTFEVPTGKSTIEVKAYPGESWKDKDGLHLFEYQIKGDNQGIYKGKIQIRFSSIKDSLIPQNIEINPNENEVKIKLKNNAEANIEYLEIEFNSKFFHFKDKADIGPKEVIEFKGELMKDKIFRLSAGEYDYEVVINKGDSSILLNGKIDYLENEDISSLEETTGLLVRKKIVTKENRGNTKIIADVSIKKNILSRLFTTNTIEPMSTNREGLIVNYEWERGLNPGESYTIISSTNYTIPFVIIVLIIIVALLVRFVSLRSLIVSKNVSLVNTKGGEFALKIKIKIKAGKASDNIKIIDKLPAMTKLYNKFGRLPDKIDKETRKIEWNIGHLNKGEERVFSYIIYSKLRAVGRFELPLAQVSYEKDGDKKTVLSNKAYFVSESVGD